MCIRDRAAGESVPGQLTNWPVQIKLAPTAGPAFAGRDLLIAADCTAYTYGDFHRRFLSGRTLLILSLIHICCGAP